VAKSNFSKMLNTVSVADLKSLLTAKEKLDKLQLKKSSLEKDLASVDKEIASLQGSLGKPVSAMRRGRKPGQKQSISKKKAVRAKRKPAAKGTKPAQPSIQSLILEILKDKKKPLSVNEIADSLLKEKKYKTKSSNFKNQLRVLLYRNQRGLFKKVGAGQFGLAGGKAPHGVKVAPKEKAVAKKKVRAKKAATKKKVVQKKKAAPKKRVVKKAVKKAVAKPKSVKIAPAKKKIVQPSIESLIVDVMKEKQKPLNVYELADTILNEKKYQTTSKEFDQQISVLISKNKKELFKKLGEGKFELA